MIGALIETNERIIAALETYDTVSVSFISSMAGNNDLFHSFRNRKSPRKTLRMYRGVSLQPRSMIPSWVSFKRSNVLLSRDPLVATRAAMSIPICRI